MLNVWSLKREQDAKELPVIVPMLIYHGPKRWNIGLKLSDLVERVPEEAEKYLPDFEYILLDLSDPSQVVSKEVSVMMVFVKVLSMVFQDNFRELYLEALELLEQLREQDKAIGYFEVIIRYLMNVKGVDVGMEELKRLSEKVSAERGGEVMSIAEKLKEEGKEKERIEIAKKLLDVLDAETISEKVGLSVEKIEELKKEDNQMQ